MLRLKSALSSRYAIERELGRGGMATVYLAEDLKHHRPVAIKVMSPEVAAILGGERFLREIEFAARLTHPHILPLHDSGEVDGLLFYVMPYVEGESVRARIAREKQLPILEALRLAREVARALDYAHRGGVVHRDIKPENILLADGQAIVADFGIARALTAAGGEKLTASGMLIGTPLYMSPEQAAGGEVDGRSDQYSLACVLYEMLAGQPPFTGPTGESLVHQHLSVSPRTVSELRPAVPGPITDAIARALAKTPADRFATAQEFASALDGLAEREADALPRPRRSGRAIRAISAGVAAVLLAALGVWKVLPRIQDRLHGQPASARREWILVADFEGPDSSLAAATRDLVSAALDESEIAMTVPRDQISLALEAVGRPGSTRLTPEIARQVALRGSIRTLLQGRLARVGQRFTLGVELDDVDSSRVLFRASETAKNEDDLIPAAGRIGRKLRAELGENPGAIRGWAAGTLSFASTNSIDALMLAREGNRLNLNGNNRQAIHAFHEALRLDPEYASCWNGIGMCYSNLRLADSAIVAFETGLGGPGRLTERQRLFAQASLAGLQGDLSAYIALWRRLVELSPENVGAHNNLGVGLLDCAYLEEAVAEFRHAVEVSPFGPAPATLYNLWLTLLASGRTDEALRVGAQMKGRFARIVPVYSAVFLEQWARADSLALAAVREPATDPDTRDEALACLASVQCARGAWRDAHRSLGRARATPEIQLLDVLLSHCAGRPVSSPGPARTADSSLAGLAVRGIRFAASGDTARAREVLLIARQRPDPYTFEGAADLLEAWIAERRDSRRVLALLAETARTGLREGRIQEGPVKEATAWLVAEAFEKLGMPDSAATYYERALDSWGNMEYQIPARALASSFAHQRLVVLYAQLGRIEDARHHWKAFDAVFILPDPELRPLVGEARAALGTGEGTSRPAVQ